MSKRTVGFRFSEATLAGLAQISAASGETRTAILERLVAAEAGVERTSAHAGKSGAGKSVAAPERSSAQQPQETAVSSVEKSEEVSVAHGVSSEPEVIEAELVEPNPKPVKGKALPPIPVPRAGHAAGQEKFPVRDAYAQLQGAMAEKVKDRPDRRGRKKGGGS